MLVFQPGPAVAISQSDVVWPTYALVQHSGDTGLTCDGLESEIHHVGADIHLLNHAQVRVEDILHSAFDMERYGGSNGPGGMRQSAGAVEGKEAYAAAREQIVASLKIANQRQDYLESLRPACKPKL